MKSDAFHPKSLDCCRLRDRDSLKDFKRFSRMLGG
jgi:hypothetical protein